MENFRDRPDTPNPPGPADRPERFSRINRPEQAGTGLAPVVQPYQRRLDQPSGRTGDTPREAIRRFDPERAGLQPITAEEAKQYVRQNVADRPWLNHAQYVGPDTCRVLAALDKGGGHALERHGSTVTPELTENRVTKLADPAVAEAEDRTPGRDAFTSGMHACGDVATRIRDPHAFATCFVRGVEHPKVRERLDQPCGPGIKPPGAVTVPLVDLLGPGGHAYCDGHRLEPVGGSDEAAFDCRLAWVDAVRQGRDPDVPEPVATRLEADDFRDAEVRFAFRPNAEKMSWEIATMYVDPARVEHH